MTRPRVTRLAEEAAEICQVAANNGLTIYNARHELHDVPMDKAEGLARAALWAAVRGAVEYATRRENYAEAECLLRCGWRPGDAVTRV